MAEQLDKPVSRTQARKEDGAMDSIFHQTDETFYETQYLKGFPGYASNPLPNLPPSARDGGAQMKRVLQSEEHKLTEQRYRERFHQQHRSHHAAVGSQRCLRNAEAMESVKQRTHGIKSRVDNDMSNLLFPGCGVGEERGIKKQETVGDAKLTMTHGKRTNSDKSGSCLWKILNPESASSSNSASETSGGEQRKKLASERLDNKKAGRTSDVITPVPEKQLTLEEVNSKSVAAAQQEVVNEEPSIEQPQLTESEKQNL